MPHASAAGQLEVTVRDLSFSFCSTQCRERFTATPDLYIGGAGRPAPVQAGSVSIKHRVFRLDSPVDEREARRVEAVLLGMMGVVAARVAGDRVALEYDLYQATAGQIAIVLSGSGHALSDAALQRLRRVLVDMLEQTEVDAVAGSGASHHHH